MKRQEASEEEERRGEGKGEAKDFVEEWPDDTHVEGIRSLTKEGKRMREKWMGGKDYARMYTFFYRVFGIVDLNVKYAVAVRRIS